MSTKIRSAFAVMALSLLACSAPTSDATLEQTQAGSEAARVSSPSDVLVGKSFALDASALNNASLPFLSHAGYLALNVRFAPIKSLYQSVQTALHSTLISRGEAHVTVLTPQEFSIVSSKLSQKTIDAIAKSAPIQSADLKATCLGAGQTQDGSMQTYFVVVQSKALVDVRKQIAKAFVAAGGKASRFNAESFTPHITVGFSDRDLFDTDGVVKDATSCVAAISLTGAAGR